MQRSHPPFLIGGGARRTLSLAGQEADIVSVNVKTTPGGGFDFSSITAKAVDQKIAWVRKAAAGFSIRPNRYSGSHRRRFAGTTGTLWVFIYCGLGTDGPIHTCGRKAGWQVRLYRCSSDGNLWKYSVI